MGTTNMQSQPLDVHAIAMEDAHCGQSLSTWGIARRLRGIGAIAKGLPSAALIRVGTCTFERQSGS